MRLRAGIGDACWASAIGESFCVLLRVGMKDHGTRYVFIAESDHLNVNFILFRFKCFVNRRDL